MKPPSLGLAISAATAKGIDGSMQPVSSDAVRSAESDQVPYSEALQRTSEQDDTKRK